MDTQAGLLAAIADRPADETPRVVYADWLDDHDDPDRAAFIRLQCALAEAPPRLLESYDSVEKMQAAADALLNAHRKQWVEEDMRWFVGRLKAKGVKIIRDGVTEDQSDAFIDAFVKHPNAVVFERGIAKVPCLFKDDELEENPEALGKLLDDYRGLIARPGDDINFQLNWLLKAQFQMHDWMPFQKLVVAMFESMAQSDRLSNTTYTTRGAFEDDLNEQNNTMLTWLCGEFAGMTDLGTATPTLFFRIIETLLKGGVDPNQRGPRGDTTGEEYDVATDHPLLSVASYGGLGDNAAEEIARLLMRYGSDPDYSIGGHTLCEIGEGANINNDGLALLRTLSKAHPQKGTGRSSISFDFTRYYNHTDPNYMGADFKRYLSGIIRDYFEGKTDETPIVREMNAYRTECERRGWRWENRHSEIYDDILAEFEKLRPESSALFSSASDGNTPGLTLLRLACRDVGADSLNSPINYQNNKFSGRLDAFLTEAEQNAHPAVVRVMLEVGADPNLRNENGNTALDIAMSEEVESVLKEFGAKTGKELDAEAKKAAGAGRRKSHPRADKQKNPRINDAPPSAGPGTLGG